MKTKDFDRIKLTPKRVKNIISSTLSLIELHKKQHALFWELIAGVCIEAPLPAFCETTRAGIHALCLITPAYRLVYQPGAKHLVAALAKGELSPDVTPPKPIGVLVPSGNFVQRRSYANDEATPTPKFYAIAGRTLIGEFEATRGMIEIAHFYNVM